MEQNQTPNRQNAKGLEVLIVAFERFQQHFVNDRVTACSSVSAELEWKRQELAKKAPLGVLVGLRVYFVFQISYRRQVTTAVFD